MDVNNLKQTTLDKYKFGIDREEDQINLVAHLLDEVEKTHGNDQWTRVVSLNDMNKNIVGVYKIAEDLQFDQAYRNALTNSRERSGSVLFSPLHYKKSDIGADLESSHLEAQTLLEFAKLATDIRRLFKDKAAKM